MTLEGLGTGKMDRIRWTHVSATMKRKPPKVVSHCSEIRGIPGEAIAEWASRAVLGVRVIANELLTTTQISKALLAIEDAQDSWSRLPGKV